MANFMFNIALGRTVEFYVRVKTNDPANAAFILVPIEFAGIEAQAVLKDKDTLADVLSGSTNEQTTMGRKVITDAALAAVPGPDDANDRYDVSLPTQTYAAATGNRIAGFLVCYDPDTTGGTDANIVPCTYFDFDLTPSGLDVEVTGAVFHRAS